MKNNCNCTVGADLYQEISRQNSIIFEKSFDCEMLKIKLDASEKECEMWRKLYFEAIGQWSNHPEYINDLMRC